MICFNSFVEMQSGPLLLLGFNDLAIFFNISGVTSMKEKSSLIGAPRYSLKCLLLNGIASASSGPTPEKKSLKPLEISSSVVNVLPLAIKKEEDFHDA